MSGDHNAHQKQMSYLDNHEEKFQELWAEREKMWDEIVSLRGLLYQCLEAMENLHRTGDTQVFDLCYAPKLIPALRERLGVKECN